MVATWQRARAHLLAQTADETQSADAAPFVVFSAARAETAVLGAAGAVASVSDGARPNSVPTALAESGGAEATWTGDVFCSALAGPGGSGTLTSSKS